MFEENEVWTPNHKYSKQNPESEDYSERTAGQSRHHMPAQMSPTRLGFRILVAELLLGNPQAEVFLANNSEQGCIWKFTCCPHYSHELFMQHHIIKRTEKSKLRNRISEVLLKGSLLCKRARAWFKCLIKRSDGKTQDIAILIPYISNLLCEHFLCNVYCCPQRKKKEKSPLCPSYELV